MLGVIARALPRRDVALGEQLRVGRLHRDLADGQMLRQRPLGRQPLPARDGAGEKLLPDGAVKLLIQRRLAAVLEFIGTYHITDPVKYYNFGNF